MGERSLRQRLLALGGIVVIVGVTVLALWAGGVLGNQGGGAGIEDVTLLDTPSSAAGDLDVGARVGELAPDFEISDLDGSRHRLSDFRGRVVFLNFWATWCVPCQEELPDLYFLQDEYGDGLAVIAVNRTEPAGRARQFLRDLPNLDGGTGVAFTVDGIDPDDTLWDEYRGLDMPMSYIVGPDGVVTLNHLGQLSLDEMRAAVDEALTGA
jgi:thiol-disulfide isomerase/thioredoxin